MEQESSFVWKQGSRREEEENEGIERRVSFLRFLSHFADHLPLPSPFSSIAPL